MNQNNLEIERKFLVTSDAYRALATKAVRITQGYLSTNEMSTIRIRRWDDQAFLTIKSRGKEGSCAHFEWEKEIAPQDAEQLFALVTSGLIDKTRYIVPVKNLPSDSASGPTAEGGLTSHSASGLTSNSPQGGLVFEIDVFHGANEGLVLAEIELPSEDASFPRPDFLGEEVTQDRRYYNSYLSSCPFSSWK